MRGHQEQEKSLQNTLVTAQRVSDEIKAGAEEGALRIVRDAESRGALVLDMAQGRVEDIQRDIDGLKLTRRDVETSIEATIQALRNTLEFVREQDARDRDDKLLTYRPRPAEPEALAG